jgi:hypothetical protein
MKVLITSPAYSPSYSIASHLRAVTQLLIGVEDERTPRAFALSCLFERVYRLPVPDLSWLLADTSEGVTDAEQQYAASIFGICRDHGLI